MVSLNDSEKKDKKNKQILLTFWIFWIGFFLFLIFPHLNRPIMGWELVNWETAKAISTQGPAAVRYFVSPAFYTSLLAFFFYIKGISEPVVRITGILCIIAMPIFIYHLIKEISSKDTFFSSVLIAGTIFLTSPAIIQGSLNIDQADFTLLGPMLCLFYIALFKTEKYSFWYRSLIVAITFALCLWTKITTPLACLIALPTTFFVQKETKKGIILSLSIFITGGVIFLITWFFYCQSLAGNHRFFEPFMYYATEGKSVLFNFNSSKVVKIIADIFRVTLWFSPLFLLLTGLVIPHIFREKDENGHLMKALFLVIFAGVVFVVYGYASATFSSFPKYLLPAFPMVCSLIAVGIGKSLKSYSNIKIYILGIVSICAGVIYYYLCVGDTIYAIYLFRQAQIIGGTKEIFFNLFRQQVLLFSFPIILFIASMCITKIKLFDRIILILFIALIANNLSLCIIQRQADYALNYAYGTEGAEELRRFLKTGGIHDVYTSVEGFIANVDSVTFHNPSNAVWNDPKNFLAFLEQEKPSCFIYGLASNSAAELACVMRNTTVRLRLHDNYQELIFGSYHVLLRRNM